MNNQTEKTINNIQSVIDKVAKQKFDAAMYVRAMMDIIPMLEKDGMPDPTTYSLHHINANNNSDLKLKVVLAMLPTFMRYVHNEIAFNIACVTVAPLMRAFVNMLHKIKNDDRHNKPINISLMDFEPVSMTDLIFLVNYCYDDAVLTKEDKLIFCLEKAVDTLQKRGMPVDENSYNINRIYATDMEDINLKLSLVIATYLKAVTKGEITYEEGIAYWLPIYNAVFNYGESDFPINVTVD